MSRRAANNIMLELCRTKNITEDIITNFLADGGNLDARDYTDPSVFWYIILNTRISIDYIRQLLKFNPNVNIIVKGKNLLEKIIDKGYEYEDRAIFLVENTNIDVNYIFTSGRTALIQCCASELYDCAKVLIDRNASIDFVSDDQLSCVKVLIDDYEYTPYKETIKLLLELIADVAPLEFLNRSYEFDTYTILNFFARHNFNQAIIKLINRGITLRDRNFIIALCKTGNTEIFEQVINNIDEDIYDPESGTYHSSALMAAICSYNFDIADILFEKGANVNFYSDEGGSPSILIKLLQGYDDGLIIDGANRLLAHDVDLTYQDTYGRTAIFYSNFVNILNILVLYGANINHIDDYNRSVLYYAITAYRHDLVKAILNFGPSTNNIHELLSRKYYDNQTIKNPLKFPEFFNDRDNLALKDLKCLYKISRYLIGTYLMEYGI